MGRSSSSLKVRQVKWKQLIIIKLVCSIALVMYQATALRLTSPHLILATLCHSNFTTERTGLENKGLAQGHTAEAG